MGQSGAIVHEGDTLPLPLSPHQSRHSTPRSTTSQATITIELPQEELFYTNGIPRLPHFLEGKILSPEIRCMIPSAAKTISIKHDVLLMQRREHLLQIYTECLPSSQNRIGSPKMIPSLVYDFFPGLETLVDKTIRGCQVAYYSGKNEVIGYYLNSKDYQILYQTLKDIANKSESIVLETDGMILQLPRWGPSDMPNQVWTPAEFEMFAIKYCEELETFLHIVYSVRHITQGPKIPSSRKMRRRYLEQFEGNVGVEEEEEIPQESSPVRRVHLPLNIPQEVDKPVVIPSNPAIKRESSGPRLSTSSRGYTNNPSTLSHSQRLSEITGVPSDYDIPPTIPTPQNIR